MRFLTRTVDAPLIAEGHLTPDGVWRVWCCHFAVDDRCEAQLEDAIVAREADEFYLAMGDLGELIVRWAIMRYFATAPPDERCAAFERRLCANPLLPWANPALTPCAARIWCKVETAQGL